MRIEALTFFRFIAAIIVVFFHFGKHTQIANLFEPFIISGPQMVTFFFALSGFVLMISHYHKKDESLSQYYVSRVARIVPIYALALLATAFYKYGTDNNNAIALLLSATFLQSWFPPYPLSFNIPGWSLSVEAFFYLTFPLILFIIRKSEVSAARLTILTLVFYIFTQAILSNLMGESFYEGFPSTSHDIIFYFPLSHYCSFLLGISGGYIYLKHNNSFSNKSATSLIAMLSMLYITYFFLQNPNILINYLGAPLAYGSSFYSPLFIITVLSIAYSNNFITKALSLRFFVLLGESSYALYILQEPVFTLYNKYLSSHIRLSEESNFYLYTTILIFISIAAYNLIEKPGRKLIFKINIFFKKEH